MSAYREHLLSMDPNDWTDSQLGHVTSFMWDAIVPAFFGVCFVAVGVLLVFGTNGDLIPIYTGLVFVAGGIKAASPWFRIDHKVTTRRNSRRSDSDYRH